MTPARPPHLAHEPAMRVRRPGRARLLILEDDRDLAGLLAAHLREALRVNVSIAGTCHEARCLERSEPHDLIVADLRLPDGTAIDLLVQPEGITNAAFILMSGAPAVSDLIRAMRLGATDFVAKPFDLHELTNAVRNALARRQEQIQTRIRHQRIRRLAGQIVRDRRALRARVDLVCRDLVGAYRRLVGRVAELYGQSFVE